MTLPSSARQLVAMALEEDVGAGDWTTLWSVPAELTTAAEIVSKGAGTLAGTECFVAVYGKLDPGVRVQFAVPEGSRTSAGQVVCRLSGSARALLTGERTALNFLQHLSGIATLTRHFVEAVAGTAARITDTRKTTPGMRELEKAAVRAGGGLNHRQGLHDMVLVKENHAAAAGGIEPALTRIRRNNAAKLPTAAEARSLEDCAEILRVGVDRILLDNMTVDELREAVELVRSRPRPHPELEATGNMALERVRAVAGTGVDFISVGALTHSAPAMDLSMLIKL